MGNILADCKRCSIVDQCDACTEVLTLHRGAGNRGYQNRHASVTSSGEAGATAGQTGGTGSGGVSSHASTRHRQGSGLSNPGLGAAFQLDDDAALAAAIAASYGSGGTGGGGLGIPSEEELVAQAMRREKLAEESRMRERLRMEQESEYEESLRMDMEKEKEKARRKHIEDEENRRLEEETEAVRREEEREASQAAEAEEAKRTRVQRLIEEARQQLSPEPGKEVENRVQVMIRTPDGRRLKRAFLASDVVAQLYHFANVEGGEVEDEQALAGLLYRLVSSMPRKVYEDREATLEAEGFKGQCALLVELLDDEESLAGAEDQLPLAAAPAVAVVAAPAVACTTEHHQVEAVAGAQKVV